MALKPQKGVAIKTERDERRRHDRLRLEEEWARIDAEITELVGEADSESE